MILNINQAADKAFASKSLKEIADAPVDALEGVSAGTQLSRVNTLRPEYFDLSLWLDKAHHRHGGTTPNDSRST